MSSESKPTISGFFPYLNDWGTIGSLVCSLDSVLKEYAADYEIIIVNDGSNLQSTELLYKLQRNYKKLRIVSHETNLGYGGALKSGIAHAQFDWIFYTDGDAQYDPTELINLLKIKKKGTDIVNGYKIKRQDPWYRIFLGKIYQYSVKLLFSIPIRDTDCDFRLMRRQIFNKVVLESNSGLICIEMIKKISDFRFKFQEVPVTHYWRTSGKSQFFNFTRVSRVVGGLFYLWYRLVIRKEHLYGYSANRKSHSISN